MARKGDVDELARGLARWGRYARSLPRGSWEAEGDACPVGSPAGAIGHVIPGHGLVLGADLKRLGITKKIPGVIERSRFARVMDALLDDRGAITSMATLKAAYQLTKQGVYLGYPDNVSTLTTGGQAGGIWINEFGSAGATNFSAIPGTNPDRTHVAALNHAMYNPPSGTTKYLVGVTAGLTGAATPCGFAMAVLLDVLAECGGIDATLTTSQTINTGALTRVTSGVGVYASWWIMDTVAYASSTTITVTYTNQAGTAGQSTTFIASGGSAPEHFDDDNLVADTTLIMPMAAGDFGVRKIQTFTSSVASTHAAPSTVGVHLWKQLYLFQTMQEPSAYFEHEPSTDPTMFMQLPASSSNVLGCHQVYWLSLGNANSPQFNVTLDTMVN